MKSILIIDQHKNLSNSLKNKLKILGYDVHLLFDEYCEEYQYNRIIDKIRNLYQRNLRGNKDYFKILEKEHFDRYCIEKLNSFLKYNHRIDCVLFIRVDKFSDFFLKRIKKFFPNYIVSYQWDKITESQLPILKLYTKKYLNKLFVYVPDDTNVISNSIFLPNYHFNDNDFVENNIYDAIYVGADYQNKREPKLIKLLDSNLFNKTKFILRGMGKHSKIEYIDYDYSYSSYINDLKKSKIIIDFASNNEFGLSFRFFEAICYDKKIITNNKDVLRYEFYNENNILITDFIDFTDFTDFINLPYHYYNNDIKFKYSLENWIKNILGDETAVPIPRPKENEN